MVVLYVFWFIVSVNCMLDWSVLRVVFGLQFDFYWEWPGVVCGPPGDWIVGGYTCLSGGESASHVGISIV